MKSISVQRSTEGGKVPAIARGAAALRLLARSDRPLGLSAIAKELGVVPSTCLYILRALVAEELVAFDPATKRYVLEAGVLTLARHWLRQNRFPGLVQPLLDDNARRFGVTMLGGQIVGLDHVIVLAVAEADGRFRLSVSVGSRFPALISATGRCIAAFGDHAPVEVRRRFRALRWDAAPTIDEWQIQVAETRRRGFGLDEGNYMAGVTVAAVPVWERPGNPSHALVAIGLTGTVGPQLDELTSTMMAEAARLSW